MITLLCYILILALAACGLGACLLIFIALMPLAEEVGEYLAREFRREAEKHCDSDVE